MAGAARMQGAGRRLWYPDLDVGRHGWCDRADDALRAMWGDAGLTVQRMAAALRCSSDAVRARRLQLGLPLRAMRKAKGPPPVVGMARWAAVEPRLRAAAEAGQPAPTNRQLAEWLGVTLCLANSQLKQWRMRGLVVVEDTQRHRVMAAPDGSWRTAPAPQPPQRGDGRRGKAAEAREARRWALLEPLLRGAAERGEACPSNEVMARAIGVGSASTMRNLLDALRARGVLTVRYVTGLGRVVAAADGSWQTAPLAPAPKPEAAPLAPRRAKAPPRETRNVAERVEAADRARWAVLEPLLRARAAQGLPGPLDREMAEAMAAAGLGWWPGALHRMVERGWLKLETHAEGGPWSRIFIAADGSWRTAPRLLHAPAPLPPADAPTSADLDMLALRRRSRAELLARLERIRAGGVAPGAGAVTVHTGLRGGCRWPCWPHGARPGDEGYGRMCDAPRDGARPYCAAHAAEAFTVRQGSKAA